MANFAAENLRTLDSEVVCRHEKFLSWRDTTHHIGQMPFACAFLADSDAKRGTMRHKISLPIVLRTDNLDLRNILDQGMAENHHHLKGSAPAFLLAWLSLMTDMENRADHFRKTLKWPLHRIAIPFNSQSTCTSWYGRPLTSERTCSRDPQTYIHRGFYALGAHKGCSLMTRPSASAPAAS
jgi:hypothetical protein